MKVLHLYIYVYIYTKLTTGGRGEIQLCKKIFEKSLCVASSRLHLILEVFILMDHFGQGSLGLPAGSWDIK